MQTFMQKKKTREKEGKAKPAFSARPCLVSVCLCISIVSSPFVLCSLSIFCTFVSSCSLFVLCPLLPSPSKIKKKKTKKERRREERIQEKEVKKKWKKKECQSLINTYCQVSNKKTKPKLTFTPPTSRSSTYRDE